MINLYFDDTPLRSGHAHRGIGSYTKNLKQALLASKQVSLAKSKTKAQVIHYPYFDFYQPSLPLFENKPRVVTIHDVIPLQYPDFYPKGVRGTLALWRQQLSLQTIACVITDSQASKDAIHRYLGVPLQKIRVTLLAAATELSYQAKSDQVKVAKKYELPDSFALYVGDINYNKQIPLLLEAIAKLDTELPLVLVGKNMRPQAIPEWERIDQAIAHFKLEKRVHFLTSVDSTEELAAIYSQAAVYVQPSNAEGFGLPILEAMQCYCPVICFAQSSMKEVGGQHAIYPSQVTASALAESISSVVSWSDDQRKKWILPAYSWAKTFSWQKTAAATIEAYQHI